MSPAVPRGLSVPDFLAHHDAEPLGPVAIAADVLVPDAVRSTIEESGGHALYADTIARAAQQSSAEQSSAWR
jgi:hypothetical protein